MALWDVLSGRVYRWNEMKGRAHCRVCRVMKNFVSSRLPAYPKYEAAFTDARDRLFAYYYAAQDGISHDLKEDLAPFASRLLALDLRRYQYLLSSLHAEVVTIYSKDNVNYLGLMLEGICDMYDRPDTFARSWLGCLEWLTPNNTDGFVARVAHKLYDEVYPILGLPSEDLRGLSFWQLLAHSYASSAAGMLQDPRWPEVVRQELAANG